MKGTRWSEQEDGMASKLWREGISASVIGERIGKAKNAIIGRMHRLGVQTPTHQGVPITNSTLMVQKRRDAQNERRRKQRLKHGSTPRSLPSRRRDAFTKKPIFMAVSVQRLEDAWLPLVDSLPRALQDMHLLECRWPLGDPSDVDAFRMCALPADSSHAYCPAHHQLAHRPFNAA